MEKRADLKGKVAIITGASSGIGEATGRELARVGVIAVLAARRLERLERLAEEIRLAGGTALPVRTDVTDRHQIKHLIEETLDNYGRIDILANIAGWGRYDWIEELSAEDLREQYEVNILGMAEMIRQVVPTMKAQRSGIILNMSSYASKVAIPPLTVYASTKYAVEGLTDGLRRELLPWGITVMRVHPSAVSGTEFNKLAARHGGIKYRSVPIGRVSREHLAREIRRLIERPRRALFISRLYDVGVFFNKLFPGLVDRIGSFWVRGHRDSELPPADQVASVHYAPSALSWPLLGTLLGVIVMVSMRKQRARPAQKRLKARR